MKNDNRDEYLIMDDTLNEIAAEETYQAYPDAVKREFEKRMAELREKQ